MTERASIGRFVIFAGLKYYPQGGWGDFYASHHDRDVLQKDVWRLRSSDSWDWIEIIDLTTGEKVDVPPEPDSGVVAAENEIDARVKGLAGRLR